MLRKNLALATIVTAPSPATTGLSLVVDTGEAARFPVPATDGDFYATLFPANEIPHIGNSEIVKVTAVSSDTFTIVRAQRGSTAKTVEAGWLMIQGIYAEDFDDLATKEYVDAKAGDGGWLEEGLDGVIVTRESTDDPTVVLRFDADVRDYIWKGMRIKATENSIVHYFIVSAEPTDDSGDTLVTCLSEIDTTTPTQAKNLIGATTISDVAYAPPKTYPKGFPIDVRSWEVKLIDTTVRTQNTPGVNTWYNIGSVSLTVPIGNWNLNYQAVVRAQDNSTFVPAYASLSTANNTVGDSELTAYSSVGGATGNLLTSGVIYRNKMISLAAKQQYFLNMMTDAGGVDLIEFRNDRGPAVIRATSTLL